MVRRRFEAATQKKPEAASLNPKAAPYPRTPFTGLPSALATTKELLQTKKETGATPPRLSPLPTHRS